MRKLLTLIKFIIKRVKFNNISNFSIGNYSGVGSYSTIRFSFEGTSPSNQKILIGDHAGVGRNCELHVWENNHIVIKDYSTVNDNCKLLGDITIEKYCLLSSNIFASSGNHYAFTDPVRLIKDQDKAVLNNQQGRLAHSKPIRIEEDCWIGYGVFIKQGVTIGRGAIIGANSVVLKDVEPYSVQGGVPAKEIRKRFCFHPTDLISCMNDEHLPYFYRGFGHKAEVLEKSRSQNCIYIGSEAIAILSPCTSFKSIIISGTKQTLDEIHMVITFQDKYEWRINVNTNSFDFTLKIENATPLKSSVCSKLYESVPKQMQKYSIVSLSISNINSENLFGINTIKIDK